MPKKSGDRNTNRGRSMSQGHGDKSDRGEGSANHGKNKHQGPEQGEGKHQGSEQGEGKFRDFMEQRGDEQPGNAGAQREQLPGGWSRNERGFRQQDWANRVGDGNNARRGWLSRLSGCFPRLFIFLLSFTALGAYFILGQ